MNQEECSFKKKALRRIKDGIFDEVINRSESNTQTILILDDYSAKVLSSYFTMSQVLNLGFYSVELERKPYRKCNACYFISPSEESSNLVINDFEAEAKTKYRRAHLFFTHCITEELVDAYASEKLSRRILTFKEANISFQLKGVNMFHLGTDCPLKLFTLVKVLFN